MVEQAEQINHWEQSAIAFDQWINATFFKGYADETLSARCWRERDKSRFWHYMRYGVDELFLCLGQKDHCYKSYISELQRKQLPQEYSNQQKGI